MMPRQIPIVLVLVLAPLLLAGCQSPDAAVDAGSATAPRPARRAARDEVPIRRVVALFDQRPWLNLDATADPDPEGIRYRVFLDPGTGRGVLRDGTLHIELYQISHAEPGESGRKLISDWHYSTDEFQTLKSKLLGLGYHLRLRWATKQAAGTDIEVVTTFKDTQGRVVRSGTKRLRVPKYGA